MQPSRALRKLTPYTRRKQWVLAAAGLCLAFPFFLQLSLMFSISPVGLVFVPLAAFWSILGIPIGIAGLGSLVLASMLPPRTRISVTGFILCGAAIVSSGSVSLGEEWVARQRAWNVEQGNHLVTALQRYHADHTRYPRTLDELRPKYLQHVPKWKHGFMRYRFIYWFDRYGRDPETPNLKFCSGWWTGVFYSWRTGMWEPQTM
jgi:hypothetical protein